MEYKEGRLGYNRKNDRYGLLVTDLWEIDGFSCGNRLQVEINGEWVDTHMEMDWSTGTYRLCADKVVCKRVYEVERILLN